MTEMTRTGQEVYRRTYSRTKPDGSKETWPETVERVVSGNMALGDPRHELPGERADLTSMMTALDILPAGRHLWASGVKGRQYLFNCHVSHWTDTPSDHFQFSFMRLMEGGGVGANYSNRFLEQYPRIKNRLRVHIVCDEGHPDYHTMRDAGLLSDDYPADWEGAHEVEDSREGWADALVDLIDTAYRDNVMHTNRVYDVSRVRAAGARLKTFGGYASGPEPLARMLHQVAEVFERERAVFGSRLTGMGAMEIDHAIASCVVAGGNRRSARMAIMHWDDGQIWEFLKCKQDTGNHWTTNISVEIDDRFTDVLREESPDGMNARTVLHAIAAGMLENGEPGIWNSDYSNKGEPNAVVATNPCGEVPLEGWENCNLGHVNLANFVHNKGEVDYGRLTRAHRLMTRFLMRATYGDVNDPKQAAKLARNRRIGVGHFGFAEFAHLQGITYAGTVDDPRIEDALSVMAEIVDMEAVEYAHNLRIPVPVKTRTVAPTGTIAKLPGTTEGIHPVFSRYFIRRIRFSNLDPDQVTQVQDYQAQGFHTEPCQYAANTTAVEIPTKESVLQHVEDRYGVEAAARIVQSADELTLDEMLSVQGMYQALWADNAVSYTANIDPDSYTVDDVVSVLKANLQCLKGATVFPDMSRPQSPYERMSESAYLLAEMVTVADGVDEDCASGACPVR